MALLPSPLPVPARSAAEYIAELDALTSNGRHAVLMVFVPENAMIPEIPTDGILCGVPSTDARRLDKLETLLAGDGIPLGLFWILPLGERVNVVGGYLLAERAEEEWAEAEMLTRMAEAFHALGDGSAPVGA